MIAITHAGASTCSSMKAQVCNIIYNYAKITKAHKSMQMYTKLCKSKQHYAKVLKSMRKITKITHFWNCPGGGCRVGECVAARTSMGV